MLFSHISDTHLGLVQYNSEEREKDMYDAFGQAIDISIKDHVDFVVMAGDIFQTPSPSGTAMMHMAHELKKLRKAAIDSFFVLGEHDISRMRSTPAPFVYHKLGFSRYIGDGVPVHHKGVMLAGFDKIRRGEAGQYEEKFRDVDAQAAGHDGHRILVLHQGLVEVSRYGAELAVNDLPRNFTYYAMGHLHDTHVRSFERLGGPLAYPGSTELMSSEGIRDAKKGFFEVDISTPEARPDWIELERRVQIPVDVDYAEMAQAIDGLVERFQGSEKKPVIELNIRGRGVKSEEVREQTLRLQQHCLHYTWKVEAENSGARVFASRPAAMEDEMLKVAASSLGSEKLAAFAIKRLLPLFEAGDIPGADQAVLEDYAEFRHT